MASKPLVITTRELSTMASSWTEYLCISIQDSGLYCLFTGRYQVLAESCEFYDDEAENWLLPEEIDGEPVVGIDDDWVVGGDLDYFDSSQAINFRSLADPNIGAWLAENEWSGLVDDKQLADAIAKLGSAGE